MMGNGLCVLEPLAANQEPEERDGAGIGRAVVRRQVLDDVVRQHWLEGRHICVQPRALEFANALAQRLVRHVDLVVAKARDHVRIDLVEEVYDVLALIQRGQDGGAEEVATERNLVGA